LLKFIWFGKKKRTCEHEYHIKDVIYSSQRYLGGGKVRFTISILYVCPKCGASMIKYVERDVEVPEVVVGVDADDCQS